MHESVGRCFCNCAIANVFFNNKRKLPTDSAVADGIKALKKTERKVSSGVLLPSIDFFF